VQQRKDFEPLQKRKIMQTDSTILIDELLKIVSDARTSALKFKELTPQQLNLKMHPDSWSVLECIEHLNLYGDFYLPEIEMRMLQHPKTNRTSTFKSGMLGNYFANLMQVKQGKIKKMKTPKDKNPINSNLTPLTLERFLKQLELLKSLLNQARSYDLIRIRTGISLSPLIKIRLGDTFRFVVFHIERHIVQAENIRY